MSKRIVDDNDNDHPETEGQEPSHSVKKPRLLSSAVHNEFEAIEVYHQKQKKKVQGVKCKHCTARFTAPISTNLKRHLKTVHKEIYQKVESKNK